MILIASQHILLTCFLWMWILYGVFTWEVRQRWGIYMNIKWESNLLNNSVINVVLVRHEKLPWNIHQNKIPPSGIFLTQTRSLACSSGSGTRSWWYIRGSPWSSRGYRLPIISLAHTIQPSAEVMTDWVSLRVTQILSSCSMEKLNDSLF